MSSCVKIKSGMDAVESLGQLVSKVELNIATGVEGANKVYTLHREGARGRVLFFPGDQVESRKALPRVMQLQDPKMQAALMGTKFPDSSVLVIFPSRLEAGFACYDHFLKKTTRTGEPLGHTEQGYKATEQINGLANEVLGCPVEGGFVRLAGFSKGGVVLNQVLGEISQCQEEQTSSAQKGSEWSEEQSGKGPVHLPSASAMEFLKRIREVHFLDVGLNSRGAYFTDPRAVESLAKFYAGQSFSIFLHGTPRQWDDANRPWICIEKNRCQSLLKSHGVTVHERKYFEGEELSLLMHFRVLEAFSPGMGG